MEEIYEGGTYSRYAGYGPSVKAAPKPSQPFIPGPAEASRPAFEAWTVHEYGSEHYIKRDEGGEYTDWEVRNDWIVWQASWLAVNASPPPSA